MYIFVRLPENRVRQLQGFAKHRNTTINALAGLIIQQYLIGNIRYHPKWKAEQDTYMPDVDALPH